MEICIMFLFSRRSSRPACARRRTYRPELESLEERSLPSAGYQQTNLVGYLPGMARRTDALLNGWGIDYAPGGAFCVANTSTHTATFYNARGRSQPTVISIPAAVGLEDLPLGPTGVVYNPTSQFVISANGRSAPATFLFATLDGLICGWNPSVDATHAIVIVDNSGEAIPASYTALALTPSRGQTILYACDSGADLTDSNDRIDLFDGQFQPLGSFADPNVNRQKDGTIFQVEDVGDKLFVTFAGFTAPYGGVVDTFNIHDVEQYLRDPLDIKPPTAHRFAYNAPGQGPLVAPWGIVKATDDFGPFSNDLLIGNVEGAGNINAFDPLTGSFLGQLKHPDGTPIAITGLWDLKYGGGSPLNGNRNDLYFTAGFTGEDPTGNGLFGVLRAGEMDAEQAVGQGNDAASATDTAIHFGSGESRSALPTPTVAVVATRAMSATVMEAALAQRLHRRVLDELFTVS
jgi:uncharacterized protein (TIGR03118 family)